MNKAKKLLVLSLVSFGAVSVAGCTPFWKRNKGGEEEQETLYFSFSVGLKSGANIIQLGNNGESVAVYDNGIDTAERSYSYASTDASVATIDQNGKITPIKEGRVNFKVTEAKSGETKTLKKDVVIAKSANAFSGGQNYSGGTTDAELAKRAEILGKLEKYAMDTHLTGITLFENGGLVKYSSRVQIPTKGKQFVEGYGFGILSDGTLNGTLSGNDGGQNYPTYYHSAIGQDSLKINQYSATGSQVSDLASYISSSYWGTKLNNAMDNYEWYPLLATDEVYAPKFDQSGNVVGYFTSGDFDYNHQDASATPTAKLRNSQPIPAEALNPTNLYKKWRIYIKTDGDVNGSTLKYTKYKTKNNKDQTPEDRTPVVDTEWNNRSVTKEDYEFIYQLLFTGSNNIIRGTEMANDTSYGIKGAQRFFNETKSITDADQIQAKWTEYINTGKLGLKIGEDVNGAYIDLELINAIDAFTAMYTLSSNLTSPLPKDLFVGSKAIKSSMKESIKAYGTFDNHGDNAILNNTICLGPYTLSKWAKNSEIVFERNNGWFETEPAGGDRYHIEGAYFRVIDTSTDTEKNWKQFEAGNLDSAGVPTSKVEENRGLPGVYETKGDATFKLNVNSCTEEEWNKLFGPQGTIKPNTPSWDIKPWMSNSDFLDGLFFSIDRESFARKRGVNPSTDYFSNAYQMRNSTGGSSYNATDAHKEAVKGYAENYGYNLNKAIDCFRNAVKQLSQQGRLVLGPSKANPTVINIHIRWMYQTDIKEYGEDIKFYFERAFNDDAVCGGKVKLEVLQEAVTSWEDVYNVWMMQGRFDLGFGAISGNTYNPLNFMEVLKSDNSSSFTLNWGTDTSKVDEKNPIIYDGKKWSFDALWEVADHGGIVENGEKIDPVRYCNANYPTKLDGSGREANLYNGFDIEFPVDFAEFDQDGSSAVFDINRMDCYIFGRGNITLAEKGDGNLVYDKVNKVIRVHVPGGEGSVAEEINNAIKDTQGFNQTYTGTDAWKNNPFIMSKLDTLFTWELYYELSINGGSASVSYFPVSASDE